MSVVMMTVMKMIIIILLFIVPYGRNFRVTGRSQINDTVEPSLTAQDIEPTAYVPDLISCPAWIWTRADTAD